MSNLNLNSRVGPDVSVCNLAVDGGATDRCVLAMALKMIVGGQVMAVC